MTEPCSFPENELPAFVIILLLIIIGTECIIGIIANGFIVVINAAIWIQDKAISTSGRILFFLSTSRITLQSFMMLEMIFSSTSSYYYHYYEDTVYDIFRVSFTFFNYCSLWFSAWLSFFYFVKIANFSCPLFLKLKWRISGLMPWLLWLSVLFSLTSSILLGKDIYTKYCNNSFSISSSNFTKKLYFTETNVVNLAFFYNLGILIPLILFILAATLLIVSLKKHTLNMENNANSSWDSRIEAHIRAIKETTYILFLYIFNAVALFLFASNIFANNSFWNILFEIIMAAYPAGDSVLLICDNPGLRRTWKQLYLQIHRYLKG